MTEGGETEYVRGEREREKVSIERQNRGEERQTERLKQKERGGGRKKKIERLLSQPCGFF